MIAMRDAGGTTTPMALPGGGGERDRWHADLALYRRMRANGDPMAIPVLAACLCYGWFFFNYHPGRWLWRGQMVRRFVKAP